MTARSSRSFTVSEQGRVLPIMYGTARVRAVLIEKAVLRAITPGRALPWRFLAFLLRLICWSAAIVGVVLFLAAAVCGLVVLLLRESAQRLRRGCW